MQFLAPALAAALAVGGGAAFAFSPGPSAPSAYTAMSPTRLLDTRNGTGGISGGLKGGSSDTLVIPNLPAGVTAVAVNLTVTDGKSTAGGFLSLYPAGGAVPTASTLNFGKGQTVANFDVVQLGDGGAVSVYNGGLSPSAPDVIIDLVGYYTGIATASASASPSSTVPAGWHTVMHEDFTVAAPLGSWGTSDANAVVYTGGAQWTEYPDGWPSTNTGSNPGYQPSQVLSVHDGVLDYYLHNVNGLPAGANPSPLIAGSKYQLYGSYSVRLRTSSKAMDDYHVVPLLWPQNDADWQSAESDFPEFTANASDTVCAYAHYGGAGAQDSFCEPSTFDPTVFHTYTTTWTPQGRTYSVDGVVLGTSAHAVYASPERLQLQVEPTGRNDGDSGHVYIDWVDVEAMN